MSTLHVVIPVFDGWAALERCLASLRDSSEDVVPVVVDHGPVPEVGENWLARHPDVVRVRASPDLWWAGATNAGIRYALEHGAERVMLLNHDCILDPGAIDRLLAYARRHPDAIISPLQIEMDTGRILNRHFSTGLLLGFPSLDLPPLREVRTEDGLVKARLTAGGRGVIIPVPVIRRIGLLDQDALPHYCSDHDFYLCARRNGVPQWLALDATVHVDAARTTTAARLGTLDFRAFVATLSERRSHFNVRDITSLMRRHYPVPGLYPVGVALAVARHCAKYLLMRPLHLGLVQTGRRANPTRPLPARPAADDSAP